MQETRVHELRRGWHGDPAQHQHAGRPEDRGLLRRIRQPGRRPASLILKWNFPAFSET